MSDPEASKYIDGIAIHWYESVNDMFTWFWDSFGRIRETQAKFPEKFIFGSEACFESFRFLPPFTSGPVLGSWHRGEVYAYDIINDLNAGVVGWTDWNLVLNRQGGPNWANNVVDAPILVDADTKDVYFKQPMFFFLGHFSKFLVPESVRVKCDYANTGVLSVLGMGFDPYVTTFVRPDNKLVITVLNMGYWEKQYKFVIDGEKVFAHSIPANSIQSILFQL